LSDVGDPKQAIVNLRILARENPDVAAYRNDLGYLLAQNDGDPKEAEQMVRAALELDREQQQKSRPGLSRDQLVDNPMYLDSLGYVLLKQKRYKEALDLVTRATESKEGQFAEIYQDLGDIHLAVGDRAQARKAWEKALSLVGNKPRDQRTREQILTKLKGLE
jgi:Flp pilus assembly protein TadD